MGATLFLLIAWQQQECDTAVAARKSAAIFVLPRCGRL
jgi:hypothetical protein